MRILHILDHSLPLHSGYTFRTIGILTAQRRLGWQTTHLTSPKQGALSRQEESVDGWHFYRTPEKSGGLNRLPGVWPAVLMKDLYRRMVEVIQIERPDVIHAHSPALNVWPAIWAGRKYGIPVVYEVRAFWEDAAVDLGTSEPNGVRYRLTRLLETAAIRKVSKVFTICQGLRADIISRGIPGERVVVVPNAVDIERFTPVTVKDPSLVRELDLQDKFVLGFCGSFYSYEGLDLIVDAMPRIIARNPGVRLLLVGGGFEEDALKRRVTSLNLQAYVTFTGRVPNESIARYYSLMDAMVFPRRSMRLTELVTPLKPLESMALGKPIVASSVGGHKELITNGKTGLLFEAGSTAALAQAVFQVMEDSSLRSALVRDGRTFVERERSWQAVVSNYVPEYNRLLAVT